MIDGCHILDYEKQLYLRSQIKKQNFPLISSRRNPAVHRLKSLSNKEGRNKYASLLLEGTHLLEEALKTNFFPAEIYATKKWLDKHPEIISDLNHKCSFVEVTTLVLEAALTTITPDGVASVFPLAGLPIPLLEAKNILALDRLQDPGNLGSLFRSALAADVELIWLASGVDPLNQKVLRSSAGSVLHLPFERFGDSELKGVEILAEKLTHSAKRNFQVIGTVLPNKNSNNLVLPYWEVDWDLPTILVLGNEGSGLHPLIKECCTAFVTLPHSQAVESLNVASAAVPLLLERRRVKMSKGIHSKP